MGMQNVPIVLSFTLTKRGSYGVGIIYDFFLFCLQLIYAFLDPPLWFLHLPPIIILFFIKIFWKSHFPVICKKPNSKKKSKVKKFDLEDSRKF